jgi:hypothetical protein
MRWRKGRSGPQTHKAACRLPPIRRLPQQIIVFPIADGPAGCHSRIMAHSNQLDPAAEGRLARARFSAAFMSDTKWRKALRAISEADLGVDQMMVKFIDVDEPKRMRFPPSLACPLAYIDTIEFGPTELRSIEWLEVEADIEPVLAPLGVFPIQKSERSSRLVGYGN